MSIKNIWRNIKNFFNGNSDKEKKKKINTDNLNRAVKEAGKVTQSAARTVERKVSRTPVRNYQKEADRAVNDVLSSFKKTSSAIGKSAQREKRQHKAFQKKLEEQRRNRTLSDFQDYGLTRSQLDKVDKTNKDVGKFFGSSVKRQLGGYGSYLGRLTREMQDDSKVRAWNEAVRTVPGFRNKTLEQQRKILKPLVEKHSKEYLKREKDSANAKLLKKTDKLIESGTKDLEELKEGKGKLGKFAIDASSAMLDTGLDMATGFALPSAFLRGSGQSAYEAEKDGANRKQALLKGTASGGIEVLTEKLTSVAKPFTKTMGKGFADDLVDRTVRKMVGKTTSELGQKAIYHGGKTLASALGEGLEEMVSEGLDPFVANKIYADAIGKHKEFSPKDVAYAGLLGATSGGAFGGVGQVVENAQINNNKQWNEANYDKIIKKAKQQAEDSQAYKTALVAEEKIKRGEPVTNMQWELMKQEVNRDIDAQESAFDDVINSAQKVMRKNNFVEPIDYVDGQVVLANNTERKHNEVKDSVMQSTDNEGLAEAIADIEVGMATMEATDLFLPVEKENRAIYESITGETLPTTNVETRKYLLDKIGNNLLKSAEEETMYRDDVLQGEQLAEVNHMGPIGQNAFVSGYEKADNKDEYRSLFNHYYRGGRSNLGFETVANMNPVGNDNISIADRFQMYNAGVNDATKGETSMASRIAVDTNKAKASDIKLMSKVANRLGINIEITDNEGMQNKLGGDKQFSIEEAPNGFYENGKIVINIEADKPLSAIFSHELTHELKEKNPEAYKQFRDFVVEAWKNRDAESLAEEINSKIEHYKANGVELTEEEAIEEILADSTWELVQNEDIINELCKQNRSLAQSILDAIEKVIEKLKAVLTGNVSLYEPRIEKKLYEELGIAEEVAKMWVDGISNMDMDTAKTIGNSKKMFSVRKDFNKKLMNWYNNNSPEKRRESGGFVNIGKTSDILKPLDIKEYDFYMRKSKIQKILDDHEEMSIDIIAKMPDVLENPIIVMQSQTVKDSIVVIGELKALNKKPVMVSVHLKPKNRNGDIMDYAIITSAYARSELQNFIENSDILYINPNKKITDSWSESLGLQLPSEVTNYGYINKVTYYDDVVNSNESENGTSISRAFARAQKNNKRFSLKEPVEVGDKLIAMHNITQDKLWKALKLGGFPMPSLAVTKAKIGHTNFGDISLLFDKSTIDPEADSRNKVYGADAWTPVFPQIDYKLNEKKADEVYNRANKVGNLAFFKPVNLADTNLKNKVEDVKGDSLVEYFKNNYGLKNMYLAEKGEPVKMLFEEKDRGGDIGNWFAENCKNEVLEYNKIENNPEDETQYVLDNKEKLSEVYANYLRKVKKENEEYITKRINHRSMLLIGVKNGLMKGMDSLEGKKDIVEDIEATEKLIEDKVNQADYEKWLKDLFAGIVEKKAYTMVKIHTQPQAIEEALKNSIMM